MIAAVVSGFGVVLVVQSAAWWAGSPGGLLAVLPLGLMLYFATFIDRIATGARITVSAYQALLQLLLCFMAAMRG